MNRAVLSLALAVGCVPAADGQYPSCYHRATYAAPAYATYTPTYAPAYTPAYYYQPFVLKVDTLPKHYYSVSPDRETIQGLIDLLKNEQGLRASSARTGPPPGAAASPAAATAAGIGPLLQARCVSCHGGQLGTKGDVDLKNPASVPRATRMACYDDVRLADPKTQKPRMPKDAEPLSAEEVELFRKWVVE